MNPARRATPDSEAVASSEDERPWPSSTTFGTFTMKENSVPGMPGGIWSTQKRGSFKMSEAAHRNAALEARLGAANPAHSALRAGSTPSPGVSEGANSLPFAIPLQPTPKLGRSLSHSQGQREVTQTPGMHQGNAAHAAALPLGLLMEEADTESECDLGGRLTQTTSHPPIGSVLRTSTFPLSYDMLHHAGNGKPDTADYAPSSPTARADRRFEAALADLNFDPPQRRSQWQSSLGWDNLPAVNESRRHSLADIPTRRGSSAGVEPGFNTNKPFSRESNDPDSAHYQAFGPVDSAIDRDTLHENARSMRADAFGIPAMYRAPYLQLDERDRDARRDQQQVAGTGLQWGPNGGRPRKQLYIVSFKCSRVDVFYLLDNTGLTVREGDLVIVEADRGQDLGTVQHAKVTPEAARDLKKKYSEEQYKWLMMYSQNQRGGHNPNAQMHGESSSSQHPYPEASSMQGNLPRDHYNNLKPKAIKRLANDHEIKMLAEKEGNEAKAKRTCQQKVAHLRLEMEILDAEWQWDFQKLIFYYYADKYINFKDLITELYRIYKTRIWLSAINPASFSQHAMGQPPSGIGPGAVPPYNPYILNNSYTMAYGEDRDPYGAQMPYRIGYETYTPNYPAIPGVANSFAPQQFSNNPYIFYPGSPNLTSPGGSVQQSIGDDSRLAMNPTPASPRAAMDMNQGLSRVATGEAQRQAGTGGQHHAGSGNPLQSSNVLSHGGIWNATPFQPSQMGGLGRPTGFQLPIGTRPMSHGMHSEAYGIHSEESYRGGHDAIDPTTRGALARGSSSGTTNSALRASLTEQLENLALSTGDRETPESQRHRARNVDHYLNALPASPDHFRTDDVSREPR